MDSINSAGSGNFFSSMLKAKPLARVVPDQGSGMKLFDPQPAATGNSKLQMQAQGTNINITA